VGTKYTVARTGVGVYRLVIPGGTVGNAPISLVIMPLGASILTFGGSTGGGGLDITINLSSDAAWTFIAAAAN